MSVTSKPALEALLGGQAALRTAGPDFAPVLRWRKSGVNPGQVVSGQQSAGLREPSKEGGTASSFTGHVIFWVKWVKLSDATYGAASPKGHPAQLWGWCRTAQLSVRAPHSRGGTLGTSRPDRGGGPDSIYIIDCKLLPRCLMFL